MNTQNDRPTDFSIWYLWYLLMGSLLAIVIFLIDEILPLGVAGGIAYIALALIGLLMRDNRIIILGGIIGIVLTIAGFFLKPPGAMLWIAVTNRALTVFMIAMTTFLFLRQNQYSEKLLETHNELEDRVKERTAQLKEAYDLSRKESNYIGLHKDIIVATNENNPAEDTMRYALERICKVTGWSVGHLYFAESVRSLIPSNIWYLSDSQRFQRFKKITEEKIFALGEGLPGRVLAGGKPVWIKDVYEDDNFPRAKMKADLGIRSGFAFPILVGKEIAGVMEFFSSEFAEEDDQAMEIMGNIGAQLGRTIERRRAHEERENAQEQMRRLCHRLELVREEERTRIAREVHDELGQVLTTLKLELSLLDKKLVAVSGGERRTSVMLNLVDNTIQTIKRISLELRPPILDVLGLAEAIEWQGKEFQDRTGIQFDFKPSPKEISMEPERSTTVFRIFQETLTNVARHAEASRLTVSLMDSEGILTLVVEDDGKGITPAQISDQRSLGILGMRERALLWGGEVDICGVQNKGTTVTIKIKH